MRQAVTGRELALSPADLGVARADDLEVRPEPDQDRAPEHQGAQDQVGQRPVPGRKLAEALYGTASTSPGSRTHGGDEGRLTGEEIELAQEATRPV